uniref:CYP71B19 n=1 Tax=Gynostemma pentaphyllum TaxID=182084 RepID=A0A8F2F5E2_GYNPE|nr:CYP71B19 [Gynostemma pentaphyllum]
MKDPCSRLSFIIHYPIFFFFSSFIMNFFLFLMHSCFHLFLLLSLLLFLVKKLKTDTKKEKGFLLPPSPPKLPIIGNLHQLGKLPHSSLRHLSRLYGPVMRLHLGRYETIIISSAEAARELLKTHDLQSCSRPSKDSAKKLTYNHLDIAFSPYSDYWREMRKTCVLELFSVKRVKSYQSIREEEAGLLIDSISESVCSETPVDLSEKSVAFMASILFRIAFGKRFQASEFGYEKFHEVLSEVVAMLGSFSASEYMGFPEVMGKMIDKVSGRYGRLERVSKELNSLFQKVIDEHLDPDRIKPEEDDIIDVLLTIKKEQDELGASYSMTHENIKGILLNIFLGGIDTGAITLIWAMAELAKHPNVMKKAQQEIRNHIKGKEKVTETETETDELPYLKMIVKETLRLHPPAPLLVPRETMSHFKLNGYDIFPKTVIQVNAWAIGRDPKYWKNPEKFFPDRFADGSIDFKGQNFELLPFGSGRRICPAIFMGVKTVELGLVNLLYCYDWKLPNGMKEMDLNMEEATGLSLTIFKKLPLKLVPVRPSID